MRFRDFLDGAPWADAPEDIPPELPSALPSQPTSQPMGPVPTQQASVQGLGRNALMSQWLTPANPGEWYGGDDGNAGGYDYDKFLNDPGIAEHARQYGYTGGNPLDVTEEGGVRANPQGANELRDWMRQSGYNYGVIPTYNGGSVRTWLGPDGQEIQGTRQEWAAPNDSAFWNGALAIGGGFLAPGLASAGLSAPMAGAISGGASQLVSGGGINDILRGALQGGVISPLSSGAGAYAGDLASSLGPELASAARGGASGFTRGALNGLASGDFDLQNSLMAGLSGAAGAGVNTAAGGGQSGQFAGSLASSLVSGLGRGDGLGESLQSAPPSAGPRPMATAATYDEPGDDLGDDHIGDEADYTPPESSSPFDLNALTGINLANPGGAASLANPGSSGFSIPDDLGYNFDFSQLFEGDAVPQAQPSAPTPSPGAQGNNMDDFYIGDEASYEPSYSPFDLSALSGINLANLGGGASLANPGSNGFSLPDDLGYDFSNLFGGSAGGVEVPSSGAPTAPSASGLGALGALGLGAGALGGGSSNTGIFGGPTLTNPNATGGPSSPTLANPEGTPGYGFEDFLSGGGGGAISGQNPLQGILGGITGALNSLGKGIQGLKPQGAEGQQNLMNVLGMLGLLSAFQQNRRGSKSHSPEELRAMLPSQNSVATDAQRAANERFIAAPLTRYQMPTGEESKRRYGVDLAAPGYAHGGEVSPLNRISSDLQAYMHHGAGYVAGGEGGGQDDQVEARLSPGEYVFDAEAVSALGDGSNEEGARRLDEMRQRIRQHKRGGTADSIPPKAKSPLAYLAGK